MEEFKIRLDYYLVVRYSKPTGIVEHWELTLEVCLADIVLGQNTLHACPTLQAHTASTLEWWP